MKTKFSLKILPAAMLLTAPWVANASLDALNVQSKLGEPLSATVSLSGNEAQTALNNPGSVSVSGAPQLKARVIQRNNTAVLAISSSTPIRDPITSFTVKVGSSSRQYSALIDPPIVTPAPVVAKTPVTVTPAQILAASEAEGRVASGDIRLGQKYTTQADDTVIAIARRIKTPNVTLGQAMRAIIAKNPHAFRNGNPNVLLSGVTLRIPTAEELARPVAIRTAKKPTQTVKPKVVTPKTEEQAATTPPTEPPEQAEKPVMETPASEPVGTAASETAPAASETAAASETPPATASEIVSSEVVAPPVIKETPPAPPAEEPSGIDWMAWLPYIGGGLLLLLLLALLLNRRGKDKTKASKTTQAKEFIPTSDEFDIAPAAIGTAATIPAATQAEEEWFDDDITFEVAPEPAAAKVNEPPALHRGIEGDIPVLTDAAGDDEVIFDLPDLDLSKEEKTTSFMEAESFIDETHVKAAEKPQPVDFQADGFEVVDTAPPPAHDEHAFDFDFESEDSAAQFMDEAITAPRRAPSVEDQLADGEKQKLAFDPSLGLDLALTDEPVQPAAQQHTATDFAFDLSQVSEAVQPDVVPPAPEPSYEIDLEPTAATVEDDITFDLGEPETPLEFGLEEPATAPSTTAPPPIVAATAAAATAAAAAAAAATTAVITPPAMDVSNDAPLQAKLELAKMYLSMDDTEGAVETLYDLMDNCEEGDAVYQEAEALLATLPQA